MATEKPPNDKLKWNALILVVACIVGLVTGQADRILGKGEDLGAMKAEIQHNKDDIAKLDEKLDKIIDILTSRD